MRQSFRGTPAPDVDYTFSESASDMAESYWLWARKAAPSTGANLNVINVTRETRDEQTLFVARFSEGINGSGSGIMVDDAAITRTGFARYALTLELDPDAKRYERGPILTNGPLALVATVEEKTVDLALSHWIGEADFSEGRVAFDAVSASTQQVLNDSWLTLYQKLMAHLLVEHVQ